MIRNAISPAPSPHANFAGLEGCRSAIRSQIHENTAIRVTLIEPGMTDTEFFEERPQNALADDDIARMVMFALSEADHVDINQILVRPASQTG